MAYPLKHRTAVDPSNRPTAKNGLLNAPTRLLRDLFAGSHTGTPRSLAASSKRFRGAKCKSVAGVRAIDALPGYDRMQHTRRL